MIIGQGGIRNPQQMKARLERVLAQQPEDRDSPVEFGGKLNVKRMIENHMRFQMTGNQDPFIWTAAGPQRVDTPKIIPEAWDDAVAKAQSNLPQLADADVPRVMDQMRQQMGAASSLSPAFRTSLHDTLLKKVLPGSHVVLDLDASKSVQWDLIQDAAKEAALHLAVKGCPLSAVLFHEEAKVLAQSISQPQEVQQLFHRIDGESPGGSSTLTAPAVKLSCDMLVWSPDTHVLVFTDGATTDGHALRGVLQDADRHGIHVTAIGLGEGSHEVPRNFPRYVFHTNPK